MSIIDYIIIGIIAFSVLVSLIRGFFREALSLTSWILAFIVASQFYPNLANLFSIQSEYLRNAVSIAILFVATLIAGAIITYIISQLVNKTGLSGTDRVLGGCFGFLRGVLLVAALLFFVDTFTSIKQTEMWQSSQLIPHFGFIIEIFFQQLQTHSSFLKGLS